MLLGKISKKQVRKVRRLHQRIGRIRNDSISKAIAEMVRTKLSYIVIADLNVKGMMKYSIFQKAVQSQKFSDFRVK